MQLFTQGEFSLIGGKVIGAAIIRPNFQIAQDIARYYLACAICDVVSQCTLHGGAQPIGPIFDLTAEAFAALCDGELSTREIYTAYFTALLTSLGFGVEDGQDINYAYMHHLDIKIPYTNFFI